KELHTLKNEGGDTQAFFARLPPIEAVQKFRNARTEVTATGKSSDGEGVRDARREKSNEKIARRETDDVKKITKKPVRAVGSFIDSLFFDLVNLGSARPEPEQLKEGEKDSFERSAEETAKHQAEQGVREVQDEEQRRERHTYRRE